MAKDICKICGKGINLAAPHSYNRDISAPVHLECYGIGRKITGQEIIMAYNLQDHYDMSEFKPLPVMIDEALAEARK